MNIGNYRNLGFRLSIINSSETMKAKVKRPRAAATGGEFSGTSSHGDISEALQFAIQSAKGSLEALYIKWTLVSIAGANGGAVGENSVTVKIVAFRP